MGQSESSDFNADAGPKVWVMKNGRVHQECTETRARSIQLDLSMCTIYVQDKKLTVQQVAPGLCCYGWQCLQPAQAVLTMQYQTVEAANEMARQLHHHRLHGESDACQQVCLAAMLGAQFLR